MAAKIRAPEGMMSNPNRDDGGSAAAMSPPRPTPAPAPTEDDQQLYTEEEMRQHGLKCAVLSKWDTVLRQLYFEKEKQGEAFVANTIFELMVHLGFENPPEPSGGQEAQ